MTSHIRQHIQQVTDLPAHAITINERERLTYQSSNLYDVRFGSQHWIAKEFVKENEIPDSPEREFKSLQLLSALDIAPQPIDYLPYPEYQHPVVLYDFIHGEMWQGRPPSAEDLAKFSKSQIGADGELVSP